MSRTRTLTAVFAAVVVMQGATLLPFAADSAIHRPQILSASWGWQSVALLVVASSLLMFGVLGLVLRWHPTRSTAARVAVAWALATAAILQTSAGAYYSRFGTYPTQAVLADFVAAPAAFLGYTLSGLTVYDLVLATASAVFSVVLALLLIRHGARHVPSITTSVGASGTGALLCAVVYLVPPYAQDRQHAFLVAEHSTAAARYLVAFTRASGNDTADVARDLRPVARPRPHASSFPRPRHVVLVIAEAVRADHLAAYGYARQTMPALEAQAGEWLRFDRAYAHGPRTADSFPVIFNSSYLAAIDRTHEGASAFWERLRAVNVRSAFLSAGAMQWSGIDQAVDLDATDVHRIASDVPAEHRKAITDQPFDYAIDDAQVIGWYEELMATRFAHERSFVTIHLVGSHYPFHYEGTPDVFVPSIRQPAHQAVQAPTAVQTFDSQMTVGSGLLTEIGNSYDNSLRHIDAMLARIFAALGREGLGDDSVVILSADHGESLGEHHTLFHGTTLYDEQVRVPLLFRVGANLEPIRASLAGRAQAVVGQIDLIPTVLDMIAGDGAVPLAFQGRSLLSSSPKPYELLVFRGIGEQVGIVSNERKMIYDVAGRRASEFDLAADPGELHDEWQGDESALRAFAAEVHRRTNDGTGVAPGPNRPAGLR